MRLTLSFTASLDSLAPLATLLGDFMAGLAVDESWRFALDLAVCEAASNVIRHALHEDVERQFMVTFDKRDDQVIIIFTDDGDPFPEQGLPQARQRLAAAEADAQGESGRGLMLIIACVDVVRYEQHNGYNRLMLSKNLACA